MHSEDLDGDGYIDLVLGNYGLNSMFRASVAKPLSLYVNDFDNNGRPIKLWVDYGANGDDDQILFPSEIDSVNNIYFLDPFKSLL